MMENLGSYLKRERELRRISLAEVAKVTRINLQYLSAIESDHFERLPGITYARGFLRAYAQCIGLNDHDTLLRFDALMTQLESYGHKKSPLQEKKWIRNSLLVIGILIPVGLAIWLSYANS